jgi:hypothetical protein
MSPSGTLLPFAGRLTKVQLPPDFRRLRVCWPEGRFIGTFQTRFGGVLQFV